MPIVRYGGMDGSKSLVLWDNRLNYASLTQDGTLAGYPAINAAKDPNTWSVWRGDATGSAVFSANIPGGLGLRQNNCLAISNHNLASAGCSIRLRYSGEGSDWADIFPNYTPLTDEDLIFYFPAQLHQYWRVVITGPNSSIGVVYLGEALRMPHPPIDDYTPLHHARRYTKMFNDSIKGQFLGNRVMAAGAETQVDFGFVERDFVDGPLRGFEDHYNKGGTFFYAGWPAGKPQDVGYCRALGDDESIAISYIEADKMASLSFGMRAFVGTA